MSYRLYRIYYNLYLHPLAKVPGPKLYAISWIPRVWKQQFAGTHWKDVVGLHEKYGGIVRTGPDEVSNASARSWDDICGTSRTFPRDLNFLRITQLSTEGASFLSRDREGHHFVRRLLQPALTDRAMAPREAMLRQWTQKLRLSIEGEGGGEFDVGRRLCWFTFDTMGDMAFGESFGCLDNNRQHPYLTAVELGAPFLSVLQVVLRFKVTRWLYDLCTRLPWMALWNSLRGVSDDKTARWLDSVGDEDRQDFMSTIYRAMRDEDRPITMQQAKDLASILCLAGAESTPVLMAGMMWWILSMPRVHARLRDEIRHSGVIRSADDITVKNVSAFSYLDAVIMEGLRLNTPFSVAIPRIVPEGGAMVDGYFLPEGVRSYFPPSLGSVESRAEFLIPRLSVVFRSGRVEIGSVTLQSPRLSPPSDGWHGGFAMPNTIMTRETPLSLLPRVAWIVLGNGMSYRAENKH